jgi:hypothetical protein
MTRPLLPTAFALAALLALPASASTPVTLDQAMAHPDWIGTPVEAAWWSWDGKQVLYKQKRTGSPVRDIFAVGATKAGSAQVKDAELSKLDSADVLFNRERTRAIVLRNGDLFERDLKTGALVQVTRSNGTAIFTPQYSADGRAIQFRMGDDWYSWNRADRIVAPVAVPRAAKDPNVQEADALRDMQLRLIATLKRQKDERDATRARTEEERRADPTRAPGPIYLGDKAAILSSALSPDGRWLLVVTGSKEAKTRPRRQDAALRHRIGYEEFSDERTRVGRNTPQGHGLKLVDLATREVKDLALRRPARHRRRSAGGPARRAQARSAQGQPPGHDRLPRRSHRLEPGRRECRRDVPLGRQQGPLDRHRRPAARRPEAGAPPERPGLGQLRQQ